jgi:histone-lysine N-methyltransferase SETMAR
MLIIHAENAWPHIARLTVAFFEDNRMKMESHPPYSPDIAPSDFYLFGYVKGCLACRSFMYAEELFEAVRGVLDSLEKGTLHIVFLE